MAEKFKLEEFTVSEKVIVIVSAVKFVTNDSRTGLVTSS